MPRACQAVQQTRREAAGALAPGALVAFQRSMARAPGAAGWEGVSGPGLDVGLLQRVQSNGRWMATSSRCGAGRPAGRVLARVGCALCDDKLGASGLVLWVSGIHLVRQCWKWYVESMPARP